MFKASAFKLNMFATCPQQYKFNYIDDLAKEYKTPKPYLTMGAHVHNALKDFYEQLEPEDRNFAQLETILRRRWTENRRGFDSREDEAKWGVKALNMLRLYVHRMDLKVNPVMLEDYYDMEIDQNLKLLGRIDRADALDDGTLHVIDYKTGKYKPDEVNDLQLILYAMIVSSGERKPVTKASYLYLQTMEWHTVEIDQDVAEAAIEDVKEQVDRIRNEQEFAPEINQYCGSCDFLTICPKQQEIQVLIDSGEL